MMSARQMNKWMAMGSQKGPKELEVMTENRAMVPVVSGRGSREREVAG